MSPVNPNPIPTAVPVIDPKVAPVITSVTNTKVSAEVQYQTLVTGILANLADVSTFAIGGDAYSRDDLVARLHDRIAAAEKSKASKNQWHSDVQSERLVQAAVRPLRKAMRAFVVARYGESSAKLGEFGFVPNKARKTTAKTKATAADKAKATRVARNTVGKKQRKAVKAAAPGTPPTPTAGAAPSAHTPAPSSPLNINPTPSSATPPAAGAHPTTGGAS
jgi:hypothetical protein